jgi:hypothetical protein
MSNLTTVALAISILAPILGAQTPTYFWSPRGTAKYVGDIDETIPFVAVSASYQQIHDACDFGTAPVPMKGMAFRPNKKKANAGRSWDLRITLSHTKADANSMSRIFSTNLLGANTTVVYGTTTTFNKFSWPTTTSIASPTPQPPIFTVPFNQTYTYIPALGNLCWEWRYMNGTSNTKIPVDAVSGSGQVGTVLMNVGKGCFAGTSATPATATITNSTIGARGYMFQSTLSNATSSQAAILALGLTANSQNLGWCTKVELAPVAYLYGKTDATGSWTFQMPIKSAAGASALTLYEQYAYSDPGQAAGLGLSDMAGYTTPDIPGGSGVSRVFRSNTVANGSELAGDGTLTLRLGLIVGWLQ